MCFVLCLVLYNIFSHEHVIVKKTIDIVFIVLCQRRASQHPAEMPPLDIRDRSSGVGDPGDGSPTPRCFLPRALPLSAWLCLAGCGDFARRVSLRVSAGPVHFISHVAVKLRSLNIWGENGACSKRFLPLP